MRLMFGAPSRISLGLALQGGGAHGAYTWGVLDALLEDGRFDFPAICATSSGAMNAVVMAHGLTLCPHASRVQQRDEARSALEAFWMAVGNHGPALFVHGTEEDTELSPTARLMLNWTHWISPYQFNPLAFNPLREIVEAQIDFARLRRESPCQLFIAAKRTDTGQLKLFREHELYADHLLASACLPTVHQAVEIDGEAYWDGGFAANPAVLPLVYETRLEDILMVLLSPLRRKQRPRSAQEIRQLTSELAFCSGFVREMQTLEQAIDFASNSLIQLGAARTQVANTAFAHGRGQQSSKFVAE